ncbi:STAS domain-containing protein [Viridibacillus arvi]|uniref:STAS domain-containing protein n=1 Tax=Viridibacillus TaxID=496496 RepID=UPI00187B10D8|nr:STAS domain-containing protein [Viridibacillus sp. JNUCC-6]
MEGDFNVDFKLETVDARKSIAYVNGEIDAFTAPKLREQLNNMKLTESIQIELDFHDVVYMDSTGLGVIVAFYKNVISAGGDVKLIGLSPRLYRLFNITGLSDIMNIEEEGKATTNHEGI